MVETLAIIYFAVAGVIMVIDLILDGEVGVERGLFWLLWLPIAIVVFLCVWAIAAIREGGE